MLRLLAILCLALAPGAAMAEPASLEAYMGQARVRPDAVIAYGKAPTQVVELFLPKGRRPHPVVALLHGGCWRAEYEGLPQTSTLAADLARRGYAVWNIEYRRLGEPGGGYPGTFQDVGAAMDRLRGAAAAYNLDTRRLVAVGHSAGGHLALWAASRDRLPASSPLHVAHPMPIPVVVSLAGIGDLKAQARNTCGDDIPSLVGASTRKDAYADTSPAELLPSGARVVMINGSRDQVVEPSSGLAYVLKRRKVGDAGEAVTIPGAGHFDLVIPTTPAWNAIVAIVEREMAALR